MIKYMFIILFILLNCQDAQSVGGSGATCNPSIPPYPACTMGVTRFATTSTVNVGGGAFATPYVMSTPNTRYVLQDDVIAAGSAFIISASSVVLDLNGKIVTYNTTEPGEGVSFTYNRSDVHITNGSIIQGALMSEGDEYGVGYNPISKRNTYSNITAGVQNLHVSNVYVRYGGRDVGGIVVSGNNGLYEDLIIEDVYEFGTLKNRHQGIDSLTGTMGGIASGCVYRNNTIINARHRGIGTGNDAEAYGNHITLRTIATNGVAFGMFGGKNISIHDNTVIGRGEHPIGVGGGGSPTGSDNYHIYNNYLNMQTTALGEEYGSLYLANPTATYVGNSATGIRVTWGGDDFNVHDNVIDIVTSARYVGTYSPTGDVAYIDGGGKGMFLGTYPGESSDYHHNTISVTGDGSTATGVACSHSFTDGLFVYNNTITSSLVNIAIGDDYGRCDGFPMFYGNTLIKSGSRSGYYTYSNIYNAETNPSTARIVDDIYQDGASKDSNFMQPASGGVTDWYFGEKSGAEYLYSTRKHDNNNTSSVLITTIISPPVELPYANPGESYTSCYDGVQNGEEEGVDCGGSCIPCSSCSDGVQNGNETGVDCGGSCLACTDPPPTVGGAGLNAGSGRLSAGGGRLSW